MQVVLGQIGKEIRFEFDGKFVAFPAHRNDFRHTSIDGTGVRLLRKGLFGQAEAGDQGGCGANRKAEGWVWYHVFVPCQFGQLLWRLMRATLASIRNEF